MDPASLLEVKRQVRLTDAGRLAAQVAALLTTAEPDKIRQMAAAINK